MGRAVGGAGGGCAGAGLVGVLVSVAIVVWLGSQGLGGGGGDGADDGPRPTDPSSLLDAIDPPVVTVGDGGPVAAGAPSTVRATGVAPGPATVAVCVAAAAAAPAAGIDPTSCGPVLATVEVGPSGVLVAEVPIADELQVADRRVDCRAERCSVVVQPADGSAAGTAPLTLAS